MDLLHFGSISHLHHLLPRSDFINCDLFNLFINAFFYFLCNTKVFTFTKAILEKV